MLMDNHKKIKLPRYILSCFHGNQTRFLFLITDIYLTKCNIYLLFYYQTSVELKKKCVRQCNKAFDCFYGMIDFLACKQVTDWVIQRQILFLITTKYSLKQCQIYSRTYKIKYSKETFTDNHALITKKEENKSKTCKLLLGHYYDFCHF